MKKKQISLNLSLTRETLKKQFGFTLFELLVSISIIGILTALASVAYSGAQKKARDARRVQDMKLIQTAAEQYYSQSNYSYPTSSTTSWVSKVGDTVLTTIPVDPKDSWTAYKYTLAGSGYCVCANVESTINGNSTSNSCAFGVGTTGNFFCVKNQQ